jgi:acyl phosphate:glycerol-3-phosphate acyltransferase
MTVALAVGTVAAYLIGMFPTALLVGRRVGHDPRVEGSGNPGASNVYRTAGHRAGLAVLVVDAAKGALPAAVGLVVGGRGHALVWWIAAVVGHVAPMVRRLVGGKGVATTAGGAAVMYPLFAPVLGVVFGLVVWRWRMASLGSLCAVALLPLVALASGRGPDEVIGTLVVAAVVFGRHRANIARLRLGTEVRISST